MPDISMCATPCRLSEECYRAKAIPGYMQAYSAFGPDSDEKPCEDFITNRPMMLRELAS